MVRIYKISPFLRNINVAEYLKEFVTIRVTSFDEAGSARFSDEMSRAHMTGQDTVPIIIDSYGGYCSSLISMMSDIANSKLKTMTIVSSKAMSCGAMLACMGDPGLRYCGSEATIMIHDVAAGAFGNPNDLQAVAEEARRNQETLFRKMAKHAGHTDTEYFLDLLHKNGHSDLYLTAKEAKKHKLVDHIGVPTLNVNIDVNYKFS